MPIHNFDDHLGVDMTGKEQKAHFRTLTNLWRRHDSESDTSGDACGVGRALERTVGFRRLLSTGEKIYSLFADESDGSLFIHAGKCLYRLTKHALAGLAQSEEEEDSRRTAYTPAARLRLEGTDDAQRSIYIYEFLPERPIAAAAAGNRLYFADGVHLYCYKDLKFTLVAPHGACMIGTTKVTSVTEPYVPLRLLDGTVYEQRNLLTDSYRFKHTFRVTDNLSCGNAPIIFTALGKNEENVPICRAEQCLDGEYGDTLVIPPTTMVDGEKCAVTEISSTLLSGQTQYTTLVMPHTVTSIPKTPLENCASITKVHLPIGVNEVHMSFFNNCAQSLTIEYEGTEEEWNLVQVHKEDYTGEDTVNKGSSAAYVPYGLSLPEESAAVGMMFLDGKQVKDGVSGSFHFYTLRAGNSDNDPYTHVYILAPANQPIYGKTLTFTAEALPFYYESADGTHVLTTTEGALKKYGVESGNPSANSTDTPTGQALVCGCRMLASYDRRLFFSGLPAIPDAIFYSHEDADGNPNPTYVAAMNYMTDSERMAVTGLYSTGGELCVTHASHTRGKLQTHTYSLPESANALFIRLYPVKEVYSTGRVHTATVYEGRLHLLTDDGIFIYSRSSSDGYLNAKRVSGRITPVIRAIAAKLQNGGNPPFFASLGNRLALFDGTDLYLGDSVITSRHDGAYEYEWYPQKQVGSYTGDEKMFAACHVLPESLRDAFFVDDQGNMTPLTCEQEGTLYPESEVEVRTAKTFEDGSFYDHTVYCARESGALLDALFYRTGGTLHPPTAAALFCGLLVFGTEEGALLAYNTDTDYESAGEDFYLCDGHRVTALLETFAEKNDRLATHKRTQPDSSYVFLRPMAASAPTLILHADGRDISYSLPAAPFNFDSLSFDTLSFTHGDTAALPIPEQYDYIEKSYTVFSDMPFAFLGLSYSYDLKN